MTLKAFKDAQRTRDGTFERVKDNITEFQISRQKWDILYIVGIFLEAL